MMVFPLRRSVGLKAATASSRGDTLPMFVRSRPPRTRWTISLTIGLDNEVDRQAVGGARLGRPDDGHQCSSGSDQACGPLLDITTDDIEHQVDCADVFQGVVVEVDKLLRAEVERRLVVGGAWRIEIVFATASTAKPPICPWE